MGEKRRINREITQLHKIQQIYPKEDPRTTIEKPKDHTIPTQNPHKHNKDETSTIKPQ